LRTHVLVRQTSFEDLLCQEGINKGDFGLPVLANLNAGESDLHGLYISICIVPASIGHPVPLTRYDITKGVRGCVGGRWLGINWHAARRVPSFPCDTARSGKQSSSLRAQPTWT
jgi:hypothetical protein